MIAFLAALPLLAPAPLMPVPQRGGPNRGTPANNTATPAGQGGGAIPEIQDAGEYYIINFAEDPNEALTLADFIKACQEATGRNFTYDQQAEQMLNNAHVRLFGSKRVPKEDFYAFFQIMMFINSFATVEVGPPHLSVVVIQSLAQGAARNIRQRAVDVTPEELYKYADQPAVLVRSVVHLPNSDVRQLSTSLRALMTDNTTQSIIAAGDSRSLILTDFGTNVASLARLLKIVDDESAVESAEQPVFAVIPVEYASAEDLADLIDQLLEARNRSNQGINAVRRAGAQEQGVSGALRGQNAAAKILVDNRTNSLLVMALPDEMPNIRDLVARLDIDVVEPDRNYHIYNLQNVSAEPLSDVLEDFLQDASRIDDGSRGTGGRAGGGGVTTGGGGRSNQNDVVVVPEPNTNSLLIAANKTRYQEVLELIRQLDRRQDQVLIETALIELTGSDTLDLGFEWGLADLPTDGTSEEGGFGATSFGLSTLDDLDGDGVIDTRIPNFTSGITAGILDGGTFNLPLLMRFLETRDDTNVLSVPSVLVNNNGSANVSTVDEQPFTQVTSAGVGGQTQENFQGYEEAGINLTISPSITASRYLRLGIELQVSNFLGTFTGGSIPPPRTTRTLSTSVNIPDGDTMVIGGIITDNNRTSSNRVPFLADIPLLGRLFRRDVDSNNRTTLYFFVTPHIMQDDNFADLAEYSYVKKLNAAEVIGLDRVQLVDPTFGASRDELKLEAFEVPLYRNPTRGEVDAEMLGIEPTESAELMRLERENNELDGGQ